MSLQLETVPDLLPNCTVPLPCTFPKPEPVMLTCVPAGPEFGATLVMFDGAVTVKFKVLLVTPPTVTETGPLVVPFDTTATILVPLQLLVKGTVLLKLTVLTS